MNWHRCVLTGLVVTICLMGFCVAACPDALHKTGIAGYALSPDGAHIAAIAEDGALFVWNVAGGRRIQMMECVTPEDFGHPILFGPDSTQFAIKIYGAVQIYEVPSGRVLARLTSLKQKSIKNLVFSGDGLRLAAADQDGATVWDTETQAETFSRLP